MTISPIYLFIWKKTTVGEVIDRWEPCDKTFLNIHEIQESSLNQKCILNRLSHMSWKSSLMFFLVVFLTCITDCWSSWSSVISCMSIYVPGGRWWMSHDYFLSNCVLILIVLNLSLWELYYNVKFWNAHFGTTLGCSFTCYQRKVNLLKSSLWLCIHLKSDVN